MIYKKHITLTFIFSFSILFAFSQTFLVLEKMGTKKRFVYHTGQQIEYQLAEHKSFERNTITNILDSALVTNNDTISFSEISTVNVKSKRETGIVSAAGPVLISAGVVLLAIDAINRGLIQEGGYTWDSGIGATSAILVTTGALIMVLKKDKKNVKENGWWRLRKVAIN